MPDAEEVITALIALFGVLGFIGFLGTYIPVINTVPFIFSGPHFVFMQMGGLLNKFVAIGAPIWAAIFELLITILFAVISYFVGH